MSRMPTSFFSQDTSLRSPSLTPKSPRRSPHRRLYNPCRRPSKTWGLWNDAYNNCTRTTNQRTQLSLHHPRTMRSNHNWLHLPTSNRLKIPHCLLLRKPHRLSCSRHSYPNALRFHRGLNSYNCPRINLFCSLLSSKHHLRTHPQPNHTPCPRPPNSPPPNNLLMIYC